MSTILAEPVAAQLTIHRVAGARELASLADEWNALAGDVPFRQHQWLDTWWRHYGRPVDELFVLLVRDDDGQLLGIAPWYCTVNRAGVRVVRQLGSGEVASDYVGLLAEPAAAEAVAVRLADWLTRDAAAEWDLIDIVAIPPSDTATNRLVQEIACRGHIASCHVEHRTWRVPLAPTWDQYLASISKSRREQMRRQVRRELDAGVAVPRCVVTSEDLTRGLEILEDLHQRRRQSLGELGCFASPLFRAFHHEVARRFLELGRLRLRWLEIDGRPAAVEYSLTGHSAVYYYQSGFDPQLAEYQPGWLSLTSSLRAAIDERYQVFDFLRGDEAYKASLGGVPEPLENYRIVGRGPRARAAHAYGLARTHGKKYAKHCWQWIQRRMPLLPKRDHGSRSSLPQGGDQQ